MHVFFVCAYTIGGFLAILTVCIIYHANRTKIEFWEIKGITNRWMYLEEVPPIFSLWDKKEV